MAFTSYADMTRRTVGDFSNMHLQLNSSNFKKVDESFKRRKTSHTHPSLPTLIEGDKEDDASSFSGESAGGSGSWKSWERDMTASSNGTEEGESFTIWNQKEQKSTTYYLDTPPGLLPPPHVQPLVSPHTIPPSRSASHYSSQPQVAAHVSNPAAGCPFLMHFQTSQSPIPPSFQTLINKDEPWFEALSVERKAHVRAMVARLGWLVGTGRNNEIGWTLEEERKRVHEFFRKVEHS